MASTTKPTVKAATKPGASKPAVKSAAAKTPVKKAAAPSAKPAIKKAASPLPAVKTAPPARKIAPAVISDEQRYRMIAEAAYYRAESCQFKSDPLRDWIEAEKDIAALLNGKV